MSVIYFCLSPVGGGGGGVQPYISHTGMCRHRVGVLRRFSLKTSIHFAQFGLESGWSRELRE